MNFVVGNHEFRKNMQKTARAGSKKVCIIGNVKDGYAVAILISGSLANVGKPFDAPRFVKIKQFDKQKTAIPYAMNRFELGSKPRIIATEPAAPAAPAKKSRKTG